MKKNSKTTKENLEAKFDAGESVSDYFKGGMVMRRFNLDMPEWALVMLDREAARQGQSRQALVRSILISAIDVMIKEGRFEESKKRA